MKISTGVKQIHILYEVKYKGSEVLFTKVVDIEKLAEWIGQNLNYRKLNFELGTLPYKYYTSFADWKMENDYKKE